MHTGEMVGLASDYHDMCNLHELFSQVISKDDSDDQAKVKKGRRQNS